ncbi:hypothetical protein EDC01DRAFT_628181 [Geopyxis carbonaria]|nr:hypothetical protein EDC01DRAFT_628181 [Geopyxis carbonaria]
MLLSHLSLIPSLLLLGRCLLLKCGVNQLAPAIGPVRTSLFMVTSASLKKNIHAPIWFPMDSSTPFTRCLSMSTEGVVEVPPRGTHRGPYILNNHILLESIISELPELSDVVSLSCVSRQIYRDVKYAFPLQARKISFEGMPRATTHHVSELLSKYLAGDAGSPVHYQLLNDMTMVRVGGDPLGSPYTDAWRFLRELNLSGTSVDSILVKALILACAGGSITTLSATGDINPPFDKDFQSASPPLRRLVKDQGLRLRTLDVSNCRNVSIDEIISLLREIYGVVSYNARKALNRPGTSHPLAALWRNTVTIPVPEQLVPYGFAEEDISAVNGLLPTTSEGLKDYGLPCFSLTRLNVANVNGLKIYPRARVSSGGDWDGERDFQFTRIISQLNHVAGCLGLDVDVIFCQGSACMARKGKPISKNINYQGLTRNVYMQTMARFPGEKVIVGSGGRIFRIPKHMCGQLFDDTDDSLLDSDADVDGDADGNAGPQGTISLPDVLLNAISTAGQPPAPPPALGIAVLPFPQSITGALAQYQHLGNLAQYQQLAQLYLNQLPHLPTLPHTRQPSSERQPLPIPVGQTIAMPDPRGLCDICEKELYICEKCNKASFLHCKNCTKVENDRS